WAGDDPGLPRCDMPGGTRFDRPCAATTATATATAAATASASADASAEAIAEVDDRRQRSAGHRSPGRGRLPARAHLRLLRAGRPARCGLPRAGSGVDVRWRARGPARTG